MVVGVAGLLKSAVAQIQLPIRRHFTKTPVQYHSLQQLPAPLKI
jgi:hypothetical protein